MSRWPELSQMTKENVFALQTANWKVRYTDTCSIEWVCSCIQCALPFPLLLAESTGGQELGVCPCPASPPPVDITLQGDGASLLAVRSPGPGQGRGPPELVKCWAQEPTVRGQPPRLWTPVLQMPCSAPGLQSTTRLSFPGSVAPDQVLRMLRGLRSLEVSWRRCTCVTAEPKEDSLTWTWRSWSSLPPPLPHSQRGPASLLLSWPG